MGVSQTVCGEHKAKSARLGGLTLALTVMAAPIASAATFTYGSYSVVNDINVTISAGSGSPALPNGFEYGYFGSGQIVLYGSGPNINQTLDVWCVDANSHPAGKQTPTLLSLRQRIMVVLAVQTRRSATLARSALWSTGAMRISIVTT